jgi:hypothetical protein
MIVLHPVAPGRHRLGRPPLGTAIPPSLRRGEDDAVQMRVSQAGHELCERRTAACGGRSQLHLLSGFAAGAGQHKLSNEAGEETNGETLAHSGGRAARVSSCIVSSDLAV